jgi:hypothetical protein
LAASLSARKNSRGIARIGNARKPNNLRDNIFAVTQMPEIVGLLCSYKTNNLHIFRTETFYHLNPRLPLTSKVATRKSINGLTPRVPPIDFPISDDCKGCARVEDCGMGIADFGFEIADCRFKYSGFSVPRCRFASDGIFDRFQVLPLIFLFADT